MNKIKIITDMLDYEESAYELYLAFNNAHNKEIEVFNFLDGLNILFDTPLDAVVTLCDKGISTNQYALIYRDREDELCVCDYISECSIINVQDIVKWIIENDCDDSIYQLMKSYEIPFVMSDNNFKTDDDDFAYNFANWIDANMDIKTFIKSDWDELLLQFHNLNRK